MGGEGDKRESIRELRKAEREQKKKRQPFYISEKFSVKKKKRRKAITTTFREKWWCEKTVAGYGSGRPRGRLPG